MCGRPLKPWPDLGSSLDDFRLGAWTRTWEGARPLGINRGSPWHVRLWSWVEIAPPERCWIWRGTADGAGYGQLLIQQRMHKAHRLMWRIYNAMDELRHEDYVCHSCDTPGCVNPKHLWIGTQKQNMADAVRKKRFPQQHTTHCPRGHAYTAENTITHISKRNGRKQRSCRACGPILQRIHRARQRAKEST